MPVLILRSGMGRVATGVMCIVFAVFLMSLQDAIIKYTGASLPFWQLCMLRSSMVLPVALVYLWGAHPAHAMTLLLRALSLWPMARAGLLVGMYVSLYAAAPLLDLSSLAAGFYTGPLFIALLSALLIGEPVTARNWLAVATGFAGILLILRPGLDAFRPVVLLPVLSGFLYALAAIATRSRCREEQPVVLALALIVTLLVAGTLTGGALVVLDLSEASVALSPILLADWAPVTGTLWATVSILAVLLVGIAFALAFAYQSAPPAVVATFDYSYLLFATMWGILLFAEWPDVPTVAGMILIAGGGLLAIPRSPPSQR